jgi:hypothetical protein
MYKDSAKSEPVLVLNAASYLFKLAKTTVSHHSSPRSDLIARGFNSDNRFAVHAN